MGQGFFRFFCILGQNCGRDKHGMGWDKHHGAIHSHMGGIYGTPHTPHILYIFVHLFGPKTVILGVSGGFDWNPP